MAPSKSHPHSGEEAGGKLAGAWGAGVRAHRGIQAEGEAAEELRERGGQVEARQALPNAVAGPLAEGDEALDGAPAHFAAVLHLIGASLQSDGVL